MLGTRAVGRFSRRLALGSTIGIAATVSAFGAADGCTSVGDYCAPDPSNEPLPDFCFPLMPDAAACTHNGGTCKKLGECCSDSCVDGVCACLPTGGKCMSFSDCCSKACTAGVCEGDASTDGPIESACSGVCRDAQPQGWDFPSIVWMGAESDAPPCPNAASVLAYQGRADPTAPVVCGKCSCGGPTGSCGLPATLTASSAACPGTDPNAVVTPFDPPSGWDGGCTANDAVGAGQLCDGGPCVQSLTIAPPLVNETGCVATLSPTEQGDISWATFARSCKTAVEEACDDNQRLCVAVAPPGWKTCIFEHGDFDCPTDLVSVYSEKHTFFAGVKDTRSCTACTCDPPVGSTCSAEVFVYGDSACATVPSYAETILSTGGECHDLAPGAALGSKSSSAPIYAPGACQPGGGQGMGGVMPAQPSTFCCMP